MFFLGCGVIFPSCTFLQGPLAPGDHQLAYSEKTPQSSLPGQLLVPAVFIAALVDMRGRLFVFTLHFWSRDINRIFSHVVRFRMRGCSIVPAESRQFYAGGEV